MSHARLILSFIWLIFSVSLQARQDIFEVETNDRIMKVVNLTLGRSTVLSFDDKPVKVVLGNSNYFNVEFIGNDLTIQPLASIETNLFVYTQKQSKYGFIIRVGNTSLYNDIIYVKWKSPKSDVAKDKIEIVTLKVRPVQKVVLINKGIEIKLVKITKLKGAETYLFDFMIRNIGKNIFPLNSIDLYVTQAGKRILEQKLVLEKDQLRANEALRARIITKMEKSKSFSVNFVNQKKIIQKIVPKEFL